MNIKVQPKIHNRFDIYKKNVVTGEQKQVGYAENIVLNQMWSRLCSGSTYFVNIHYGTGTGILDPARTSLFTHLGTGGASTVETVRANPTSHWRRSITLGLTTAVGAELTEVGIAYGSTNTNLVTHAQIRDMNGNVISILKTDVDIITIYATIYVTLVNNDTNFVLNAPDDNSLLSYLLGGDFPGASFSFSNIGYETEWASSLTGLTLATKTGSWSNDVANKKRLASEVRLQTTEGNNHLKEILFAGTAKIVLPKTGVYSGLELANVPLGVGDGETTKFYFPSRYIKESSIVVKKDGVVSPETIVNDPAIFDTKINDIPQTPSNGRSGNCFGRTIRFSRNGKFISFSGSLAALFPKIISSTSGGAVFEIVNNVYKKRLDMDSGGYSTTRYQMDMPLSSDGTWIATIAAHITNTLNIYKYVDNSYSLYQEISIGANARPGYAFAPSDDCLIMPITASPYIKVFENNAGTWEETSNITGTTPESTVNAIAFSDDGSIFAAVINASPYVIMYENIEGLWTRMADVSGGFPAQAGSDCAFSPTEDLLAIVHSGQTYVTNYKKVGGVWTKQTDIPVSSSGVNCSFSGDGNLLMVDWNVILKKVSGSWIEDNTNTVFAPTTIRQRYRLNPEYPFVGYIKNEYGPGISAYHIDPDFVEFSTAPAVESVITADYTVLGIHKTDQRVIDISGEIQFGEPTP